jgi:hypothetical protein
VDTLLNGRAYFQTRLEVGFDESELAFALAECIAKQHHFFEFVLRDRLRLLEGDYDRGCYGLGLPENF